MNEQNRALCPECNAPVTADSKFCRSCGAAVNRTSKPSPAVVQEKQTIHCPQCGTGYSFNDAFCEKCGSKLQVEPINYQTVTCPQCGAKNSSDTAYCNQCKSKLQTETANTPQQNVKSKIVMQKKGKRVWKVLVVLSAVVAVVLFLLLLLLRMEPYGEIIGAESKGGTSNNISSSDVSYDEDIHIKSEGVMTHEEYIAAALEAEVVIEAFVQGKQSWWDNKGTFYLQDKDGGYFVYEMACTEEEYNKLTVGTKVKVSGYKAEWSGEVEIIDAKFEILEGTYVAEPTDVTALLGKDELIEKQNMLVSFSGLIIEKVEYKNGEPGDDIYVTVSKDGVKYDFCVEYYLTGADTDVYKAFADLKAGDVVDIEGFLYWYNGVNTHITWISTYSVPEHDISNDDNSTGEISQNNHTHSYSSEWVSNGTSHWHECACGEKSELSQHTYSSGICAVCGKLQSEGLDIRIEMVDDKIIGVVYGVGTCKNRDIYIPAKYNGVSVVSIVNRAFVDCAQLTSVIIPDGVTDIGLATFASCTELTSIVIPDSVTEIGGFVFDGCTSLASITIPAGVAHIEASAFAGCVGLERIDVNKNNTKYYSNNNCVIEKASRVLVFGCKNSVIPNGVTKIGQQAFLRRTDFTKITIPDSVTEIGYAAFWGCTDLASIVIPDNVKTIGNYAFQGCASLESVDVGRGVTTIGVGAFNDCTNLTSLFWVTGYNLYNDNINSWQLEGSGVIYTEEYLGGTWWVHVAFEPVKGKSGFYRIVDIVDGTVSGTGHELTVPKGGFVWAANYGNDYISQGTGDTDFTNPGALASILYANTWQIGDVFYINGIDLENFTIPTTTPDLLWYDDYYKCTAYALPSL